VVVSATVTRDGVAWTAGSPGLPRELGRTPLSALSTETAGGFVGTTFGPYVAGPADATVLFTAWNQEDRT